MYLLVFKFNVNVRDGRIQVLLYRMIKKEIAIDSVIVRDSIGQPDNKCPTSTTRIV